MGSLIAWIVLGLAAALLVVIWHGRRTAEPPTLPRQVASLPERDLDWMQQAADEAPEWSLPTREELHQRMLLAALDAPPGTPLEATLDPAQQAVVAAVSRALERTDLSPRYTPRRPNLLPQLIHSVNDSGASSRSIAAIIGRDPVLTGNLLRIANSALYRTNARPVDSLERAVTMVGLQGVREIISAALMQPLLSTRSVHSGHFAQLAWDYTLRMSVAAADHARSVERQDGFSAQLAGLLLGLAAVVVMQAIDDVYARSPQLQRSAVAQLQLLQRYSVPLAGRIARSWELPSLYYRTLRELDQIEQDGPELSLQRSLQFGRSAAAAAMLARHGLMDDSLALAVVEAQVPEHVAQWIWKRLREDSEQLVPA